MNQLQKIGQQGEDLAADYLHQLGYRLEGRNIRLGRDEIDIIAFDPFDEVFVLVEVKTRSKNTNEYRPEMNITHRKREAMRRAGRRWIMNQKRECGYRIDIICIAANRIVEHFKDITMPV